MINKKVKFILNTLMPALKKIDKNPFSGISIKDYYEKKEVRLRWEKMSEYLLHKVKVIRTWHGKGKYYIEFEYFVDKKDTRVIILSFGKDSIELKSYVACLIDADLDELTITNYVDILNKYLGKPYFYNEGKEIVFRKELIQSNKKVMERDIKRELHKGVIQLRKGYLFYKVIREKS